jgi:SAM-dependent methyltransferase
MIAVSRTMPPVTPLAHELQTLRLLTNYHAWIFEEIRPFLGAQLAEIGGGLGAFASVLAREHLLRRPEASLEVFEPDSALFAVLDEFLHEQFAPLMQAGRLRTVRGEFHSSPQRYDTAILVNALEHIEDDGRVIDSIYESLAPRGTLIVYVPALPWLFSRLDRDVGHFRRYNKRQLRRLFESSRFEVVKAIYMDMAGILPWYLFNVLGQSRAINARLAQLYDRRFVPATKFVEQRCGAPLGKNLLIIGRRP